MHRGRIPAASGRATGARPKSARARIHLRARNAASIAQIQEAFRRTKDELGVRTQNPWHTPFYQYANRVAHLHFLRNICHTDALLVFVDFVGDEEVGGPVTADEWRGATALALSYLGIGRTNVMQGMAHIAIDVSVLQ